MAKKLGYDSNEITHMFTKLREQIHQTSDDFSEIRIPNIIEFVYSKNYLDFTARNTSLYPVQTIILKTFYRGQMGNEHLTLTSEELNIIRDLKLDNVLEKYHSGELFRELVLVLGRRSGKGFLTSVIALYEAMKLLECPGGSFCKYYNVAPGTSAYILTIATSADQAGILFRDIKNLATSSRYFLPRIGRTDGDRIWLLTPEDRKKNKELDDDGVSSAKTRGSVIIMSGHSNSDSLLGKAYYCINEDNLVLCENGLIPVKELSNGSDVTDINDLMTWDYEKMVPIDKCFNNGCHKTLILTTKSGNKIEVTKDHQLYHWNDRFQWTKASDLKIGDYLVGTFGKNMWGTATEIDFQYSAPTKYGEKIKCPICGIETIQLSHNHLLRHGLTSQEFKKRFPGYPMRSDAMLRKWNNMKPAVFPKKITNSLARLLGYIIAEGNNTQKRISLNNTEPEIIEDMLRCARNNFTSVSTAKKTHNQAKRTHNQKNWADYQTITIFGGQELQFFERIGCKISYAHNKTVPDIILRSPKEYVAEYLRGYFEGDGHVSKKKRTVVCNSTSEKLIRQTYHILLNFGIMSSITKVFTHNSKHHNQYFLHINGAALKIFKKEIGFISNRKKILLRKLCASIHKTKQNLYGFPVSEIIKKTNNKHNKKLSSYNRFYGFYGFTNQATQSIDTINKWFNIYRDNRISSEIDAIAANKLFADPIVSIEESESYVYDLHINSESHGYTANSLINHNCLLYDEVASFKTTGSSSSGERLYDALTPGTVTFNRPIWIENGIKTINPKNKKTAQPLLDNFGQQARHLDAKVISISSPRAEEGIFWKLYKTTAETPQRLSFRLPTWKVNLGVTEGMLRDQNRYMIPSVFAMEFGAEFSGTAGELFIGSQYIDAAIEIGRQINLDQRTTGRPGIVYFAHLDPASTSHNYALVVLHVEERIQLKEKENGVKVKEKIKLFVVDHIHVWRPDVGRAINPFEVDRYITDLAKRFRFGCVSYDVWNSDASIRKLRSKGIPCRITAFGRAYKMKIYNQLEYLLVNYQLALPARGPFAELLEQELKSLKRKFTTNGFRIEPDPEGLVTTDDSCDSLAGAIGMAADSAYTGYARSGSVYMPQMRMSNSNWKIGSGSYTTEQWMQFNKKFGLPV